jgi:GMP reductase
MSKPFDYKDINLVPKKSIVSSRSECDTSIKLHNYTFKLPIVPSNMECVVNEDLCVSLARNGYFYIMHRFHIDIYEFVVRMKSLGLFASISIGVNKNSYDLLEKLIRNELIPEFITIDIAHGHSILMERMLNFIRSREEFKNTFVIAGNVSTREAVDDLVSWGADSIKIGIGPGSACTTYYNTGFGSRDIQLYSVRECAYRKDIVFIADGGISQICDIPKSLTMGATMVMIGGMLTGFEESPGRVVTASDGKLYQEFYGSASEHSLDNEGKIKKKNIEGTIKLVPYKNKSIFYYYAEIQEALQSAISYGGGKDLTCFNSVDYIIKTN